MSIFYLDPLNGDDATTASPEGWWSAAFTNGSGTEPAEGEEVSGDTSSAVANVTVVRTNSGSWNDGTAAGNIYFYGYDNGKATFTAETVKCAAGGRFDIGGDLTYCAWKTIKSGATAARIAPNDTIRIRANINQPFSIGSSKWEGCPDGGIATSPINISSSTNATPIEVTTSANHGLSTGDVVMIAAHNTNTRANGAWVITYVSATKFTLDGSVGNGVGGATGTVRKINSVAVVMDNELTLEIDQGEQTWTAITGGDVSCSLSSTTRKAGSNAPRFQFDTTPKASTAQAYKATGTIGMATIGAYDKITFWFYSTSAIVANTLTLNLCSDTAGATPVDTFAIPAIPASTNWIALTLTRNGGGYLGNGGTVDIKSIALYTGTTAPASSLDIRLDNIQACTGLNLKTMITKDVQTQQNTVGWFGIQSIHKKVIVLEGAGSQIVPWDSTGMRGFFGTTELYETYGLNIDYLMTYGGTDGQIQDSGTEGSPITFSGGWEPMTNSQSGETWFDGQSSQSTANDLIQLNGKAWIIIERICGIRANSVIKTSSGANFIKIRYCTAVNCSTGIYLQSSIGTELEEVQAFACQQLWGQQLSHHLRVLSGLSMCNGSGFQLNQVCDVLIDTITVKNCGTIINMGSQIVRCRIKRLTAEDCTNLATLGNVGEIEVLDYIDTNCANTVTTNDYIGTPLRLGKVGSTGLPTTYMDGCKWERQEATVGTGKEWKITLSSAIRTLYYPIKFPLGKILCEYTTGETVTVTVKVKKSHATDISARLMCQGKQIDNVEEDVYVDAPDDTSYNTLTISFTPTATGVVEIYLMVYTTTGASSGNVIVDEFNATQE